MNKYDVMKLSNTSDGEKGFYYDPLSLPLDSFRVNRNPVKKELRDIDKSRFDLLMFRAYGSVSFDGILLMLNNVGYLNDIEVGDFLYYPDKADIDSFFLNNRL